MTVYGQIVDASQVEDEIEAAIRKWIDSYLGEIERQRGITPLRHLRRPVSYRVDTDVRTMPEDDLPAVVVVSAGMPADPEGAEDGRVDGLLLIGIACVVRGPNRTDTMRNARRYAAAVATLVEQQGGELSLCSLQSRPDERYDEIDNTADRSLAAGYVTFLVLVPGMRNRFGGPEVPDPAPPDPLPSTSPDDPLHLTTNVTVDEE